MRLSAAAAEGLVSHLTKLMNLPRCWRLCQKHLELGTPAIIKHCAVQCFHSSRSGRGPVKLDIANLHNTDRGHRRGLQGQLKPKLCKNRTCVGQITLVLIAEGKEAEPESCYKSPSAVGGEAMDLGL
jgi:hypothetical protein